MVAWLPVGYGPFPCSNPTRFANYFKTQFSKKGHHMGAPPGISKPGEAALSKRVEMLSKHGNRCLLLLFPLEALVPTYYEFAPLKFNAC